MSDKEVPDGFVMGTVNEPGYCENCRRRLRIGSRAALWNPTRELFCVDCANDIGQEYPLNLAEVIVPMMLVALLLVVVITGVAG
jgi:hypothetical protein